MKNAVERFDWWGVTLTGKYKTVKTLYQLMVINKALFENLYKVQSDTIEEHVNKLYDQVPEYEKKFLKFVNSQLPNLRMCLQFELPYNPQLFTYQVPKLIVITLLMREVVLLLSINGYQK
ncbi:hypothetical protein P9D26_10190 [Bacillus velezensis]|uniref:hypothetical protein n=1 Tax=Bacillus velezensis TaxID=492670 RepID=UPI002DB9DBBC|nr:hypothetical protein [Bacillus velezensis]MEC1393702.1 hypothetical protein [Bacillus velezensis]